MTGAVKHEHGAWLDELKRRFGENPAAWRFVCPSCGDEASGADFKAALTAQPRQRRDGSPVLASDLLGQECIGRTLGALERPRTKAMEDSRKWGGRGCDWVASGLFRGPEFVVVDGREIPTFAMAAAS